MSSSTEQHAGEAGHAPADVPEQVLQNIETIAEHHARLEQGITPRQRSLERLSVLVAQPGYLLGIVAFGVLWMAVNVAAPVLGIPQFDPPPFFWLQGMSSFTALLTSTAVLVRQARQARLAELRAQTDLQINLLSEQKVSKLITLVEELRRDLPNVQDPYDKEAEALQEATDPQVLLDAVEHYLQRHQGEPPGHEPPSEGR